MLYQYSAIVKGIVFLGVYEATTFKLNVGSGKRLVTVNCPAKNFYNVVRMDTPVFFKVHALRQIILHEISFPGL